MLIWRARKLFVVTVAAGCAVAGAAGVAEAAPAGGSSAAVKYDRPATTAEWQTGRTAKPLDRSVQKTAMPQRVTADREVPALRTRTSRTFLDRGRYRTELSSAPVNRRVGGSWIPIDTTLVRKSGTLSPVSTDAAISLPDAANQSVTLVSGKAEIKQRLLGATASQVTHSGSSATYRNAFPGTDVTYDVLADGLKESLVLTGRTAPRAFTSAFEVAQGSTLAKQSDGSLRVLDADGKTEATVPAPFMQDSSGKPGDVSTDVELTVSGAAPDYRVTVTPSTKWVAAPERVWPIVVDPTATFGNGNVTGCTIAESASTSCSSSAGTDNYLEYGRTNNASRIYLKFADINTPSSPVPADAIINAATLTLTSISNTNSSSVDTQVYRPERAFSPTATWSGKPGTTGDRVDEDKISAPSANGTVSFDVPAAVRGWTQGAGNGGFDNNGLIIKAKDEGTSSNKLRFYGFANAKRPTLDVTWSRVVGQQTFVGAYDKRLSDRIDVHVDLADRNLVLNQTDEVMKGPGQTLTVRRTYNSLSAAAKLAGAYGNGWSLNGGVDTGLKITRSQVMVTRPGGASTWFARRFEQNSLTVKKRDNDSNGVSFTAPPGYSQDLTKPDSTHYKLKDRKSKIEQTYAVSPTDSSVAYLEKIDDGRGSSVTYDVAGSPLTTNRIVDTTNQRSVGLTYTSGRVTQMTETLAAGATGARTWKYGYNSDGNMTTYTDPAGKITQLCYVGGMLTKIITPRGKANSNCSITGGPGVTTFAYDTTGRVTQIAYRENGSSVGSVLTFDTAIPLSPGSSSGTTTLTDVYNQTTTYTFDPRSRITKTLTPMGYSATSTYSTNNDVTASVSPNNFTGGTSDPASTASYNSDNNVTSTTTPSGVSQQATYPSTGEQDKPNAVSDDTASTNTTPGINSPATGYGYNGTGQVSSVSKGSASVKVRRQGDDGVGDCGPGSGAAFKGAVCETRDADYSSSKSDEHRTKYSYDTLGQLTTVSPPQRTQGTNVPNITYTYDAFSRVQSVTDQRGKTTTYAYDALDRLIRTTYDGGTYTAATYDDDGNVKTTVDYAADGTAVPGHSDTYGYDGRGRLIQETQGTAPIVVLTYDDNSRMLSYSDGAAVGGGKIVYGYNADGSLTSMASPGGSCAGFTPTSPPTAASLCTLFEVDKNGKRLRTIFPGSVATQMQQFNKDGNINRIFATGQSGGSGITFYDYNYDYTPGSGGSPTKHIYARRDTASGNGARIEYSYDNQGAMNHDKTYDKFADGTQTAASLYCYTSEPIGNRTSVSGINTSCSGQTATKYNGANQSTTNNHEFDAVGNETKMISPTPVDGTTRTSSWSVSNAASSVTIDGTTAHTITNDYLGGGNNTVLSSSSTAYGMTPAIRQTVRNTPLGITRVTRTDTTANTVLGDLFFERDSSGALVGIRTAAGAHYYVLTDILGSVLRIVNATGNTVNNYAYDSFGRRTVNNESLPQPFGYTGAYTNDVGLIHLKARWYDPGLGRFTQTDPVNQSTDTKQNSPYSYAGNDPINSTDPSGQFSFEVSFSGCLGPFCAEGSIGVDDDGDINAQGGAGLGTGGGGFSASADPEGDYQEGGYVGAQASCTAGGAKVSADANTQSGGSVEAGVDMSTGFGSAGCSATGYAGYTI